MGFLSQLFARARSVATQTALSLAGYRQGSEREDESKRPFILVHSTDLDAIRYLPSRRILEVRFRNHAGPKSLYQYANVPTNVYFDLRTAPSKGKYLAAHIKWRYKFKKIY